MILFRIMTSLAEAFGAEQISDILKLATLIRSA